MAESAERVKSRRRIRQGFLRREDRAFAVARRGHARKRSCTSAAGACLIASIGPDKSLDGRRPHLAPADDGDLPFVARLTDLRTSREQEGQDDQGL